MGCGGAGLEQESRRLVKSAQPVLHKRAAVQDVLQPVEVAESPCSSCVPTFSCFPSALGALWFETGPCTHL